MEEAGRGDEGAGAAQHDGGHGGGGARDPPGACEEVGPGRGQPGVHEDERRVGGRGRQQQVEPREGVEELGLGPGEEGTPEPFVGIPQRPRALRQDTDHRLHLGEPVAEHVAFVEHAVAADGFREENER